MFTIFTIFSFQYILSCSVPLTRTESYGSDYSASTPGGRPLSSPSVDACSNGNNTQQLSPPATGIIMSSNLTEKSQEIESSLEIQQETIIVTQKEGSTSSIQDSPVNNALHFNGSPAAVITYMDSDYQPSQYDRYQTGQQSTELNGNPLLSHPNTLSLHHHHSPYAVGVQNHYSVASHVNVFTTSAATNVTSSPGITVDYTTRNHRQCSTITMATTLGSTMTAGGRNVHNSQYDHMQYDQKDRMLLLKFETLTHSIVGTIASLLLSLLSHDCHLMCYHCYQINQHRLRSIVVCLVCP